MRPVENKGPHYVDISELSDIRLVGLANRVERALGQRSTRVSDADLAKVTDLLAKHKAAVEADPPEESPLKKAGLHDASIRKLKAAAKPDRGFDRLRKEFHPPSTSSRSNVNYCVSLNPEAIADPEIRATALAIRDAAGDGAKVLTLRMLLNAKDVLKKKTDPDYPMPEAVAKALSEAIAAKQIRKKAVAAIDDFFLEGSNGLLDQGSVKIGDLELKHVFVLPKDVVLGADQEGKTPSTIKELVDYYEERFVKSNLDRVYIEDGAGRLLIAVQESGTLGNTTRGDPAAIYNRQGKYTGVGRVVGLKDEYNTAGEVFRRYWIDTMKPRAERIAKKVETEVVKEAEDGSLWHRVLGPQGTLGVGLLGILGAAQVNLTHTLGAAALLLAGGTGFQLYKVWTHKPDMSIVFDALGVVRLRDDIQPLGA
jgi:hypothetical protein